MYITHDNGTVIHTFSQKEDIAETLLPSIVEVDSVPVISEQRGMVGYHFYNGTSVEVRYKSRALTPEERIEELEQSQGDLLMEIATLKMGGSL